MKWSEIQTEKERELIRDACWGNVIVLVDLRHYLNWDPREKDRVCERGSDRQREEGGGGTGT